ncbi:MAG: hypothetical protein ACTSPQ_15065 [Candidatus Helarchaeota archaeon]
MPVDLILSYNLGFSFHALSGAYKRIFKETTSFPNVYSACIMTSSTNACGLLHHIPVHGCQSYREPTLKEAYEILVSDKFPRGILSEVRATFKIFESLCDRKVHFCIMNLNKEYIYARYPFDTLKQTETA